ncbi:hypothetical protein K457DRAFT_141383 [Linnemannia elongata AG-77]|uniref:Uncharacterized protein n=1 Tax=Linnemannia elongata AG-77 TaxID=1314771 RepID=A0A197JKZ4_9FUNG|nr:hypothetical protein K457DRAFT_141383 [Linnemannia elongata AG-77]
MRTRCRKESAEWLEMLISVAFFSLPVSVDYAYSQGGSPSRKMSVLSSRVESERMLFQSSDRVTESDKGGYFTCEER